ncbi:type VI secretion system membrane subunit TssM [sulfur-oxidizing endosymbiont of Gigantopelta aegis]|uniref:type VI secretion system membrane subunit TssM n=1 Tax=sulfur-oxidizing endosymbiont of Gigantopelta aegis TaxID=2794934 RepID=UPI0018DD7356|nr:type VI secretion system membrane subunit TssM [sulfur-oxidizing endosymbiont of Gigantopelta aegis]
MKTLKAIFTKKWLVTLLGVIALSILIWFVGPLVAIAGKIPLASETVRLVTIMILLLLWGLNNLRIQAQAKKNNEELIEGLKEDSHVDEDASDEEVKILGERFDDAMHVLKHSSKNTNGKQYIYDLPWYVIIGPPGSGKTTALINSGLRFPLAEKYGHEAVKGVGGTRNCDWWFTDEAVLIDTAGRYTTQDSHAANDSAAWGGFLKLLKKHRKRRPINGVMVAISIQDILTQTEQERTAHVHAIRSRLLELQNQLNIQFPVYLLITKGDMIAGFSEFFDDLGRDEREQVWGMTFPENYSPNGDAEQAPGYLFNEQFDLLLKNVNDRLLWRLNYERDPQRRGKIVEFPVQLEAIKASLNSFIEQTFSSSRFHERPNLRGVYLTSGTQEGTPIDRIMGNLIDSFDIDRQALPVMQSQGKSYFIKTLLQQVIFTEANLVCVNRRFENKILWLQRASYATAIIAATASALAWSTSFTLNERNIKEVDEQLAQYNENLIGLKRTNFNDVNAQLERLNAADAIFPKDDSIPTTMKLGLYQGENFHELMNVAYIEQLNQLFMPALKHRLEEQIRLSIGHPDYLFEALKAYLMMSLPKRFEKEFIDQWMELDWSTNLAGEATLQDDLKAHLDVLLSSDFAAIRINQALVEKARLVLRKVPLHQQIYNRIKTEAKNANDEAFTFSAQVGPEMNMVFSGTTSSIPYLYTYNGYKNIFKKDSHLYVKEIAQENWVLGTQKGDFTSADIALFNDKVKSLYLEDYARYWNNALNDLTVNNFSNVNQAITALTQITGPYSPFRGVIENVAENTRLSQLPVDTEMLEKNKSMASELSRKVTGRTGSVLRMVRRASDRNLINLPDQPTDIVEKQFFDLNKTIEQKNNRPAHLSEIMMALAELQGYLNNLASTMDDGETAYRLAKDRLKGGAQDPVGKLKLLASRSPEPLKKWLKDISRNSWGLVLKDSNKYLNTVYQASVIPFYKRSMKDRYPLHSKATNEASLADFTEYFKPDGIESTFFNTYLKDFVNTRRKPWTLKRVEGFTLSVSNKALRQFERAENIRKVFFKNDKDFPTINYSLRPMYLDSNIARFELRQGDQKVTYQHGPLIPSKMTWPGNTDYSEAKIIFEDLHGDRVAYKEQGPWAFFRIMDNYELQNTKLNDHFIVDYVLEGKKAKFELIANSVKNPFSNNLLKRYRAPNSLN